MSSNLNKIIACLRFLNLHPHMYVYRWRFLTQKIAFLAKSLGMGIGYDFTIYVAGPYSRELNCEYFPDETKTKMDTLQTDYVLTDSDLLILQRIRDCQGLLENQNLMEATSTAVYFIKQNPIIAEDDLFINLKALKPHIGDTDRVIGITKAKELLFKPEYLTEEIKREIDEWDQVEG